MHQRHAQLWSALVGEEPTPPQYAVLVVAADAPGLDLTTIGRRAALDRTTVGRVVERLERDGWVARRPSEGDRRRAAVELTAVGQQRLAHVRPLAAAAEEQLLADLAEPDVATLLRLLRGLLDDA